MSCLTPLSLFTKIQHLSVRETPGNAKLLRSPSMLKGLEFLIRAGDPSEQLIHGCPHLALPKHAARAAGMALFLTLLNPFEALAKFDLI